MRRRRQKVLLEIEVEVLQYPGASSDNTAIDLLNLAEAAIDHRCFIVGGSVHVGEREIQSHWMEMNRPPWVRRREKGAASG